MFLIEGKKLVQEAFESGWNLETVIVREDRLDWWYETYPEKEAYVADHDVFKQLSRVQQSEGVLAVVHFPNPEFCKPKALSSLPPGQGFMLEAMQDPGNLGTLMRSLDWFGIPHLILGPGCVDPLNLKSLRSSMGAIFRIQLHLVPDLSLCVEKGASQVLLADMNGTSIQDISFQKNSYVLIGNEAQGISQSLRSLQIPQINIPRMGKGESLNAGVAASLIAWEMVRGR